MALSPWRKLLFLPCLAGDVTSLRTVDSCLISLQAQILLLCNFRLSQTDPHVWFEVTVRLFHSSLVFLCFSRSNLATFMFGDLYPDSFKYITRLNQEMKLLLCNEGNLSLWSSYQS